MSLADKQISSPTLVDEDYEKKKDHVTSSPSYGSDDDGEGEYVIRDKALLRKLDLRLLPALTLLYLLSFLDRSNGSFGIALYLLSGCD